MKAFRFASMMRKWKHFTQTASKCGWVTNPYLALTHVCVKLTHQNKFQLVPISSLSVLQLLLESIPWGWAQDKSLYRSFCCPLKSWQRWLWMSTVGFKKKKVEVTAHPFWLPLEKSLSPVPSLQFHFSLQYWENSEDLLRLTCSWDLNSQQSRWKYISLVDMVLEPLTSQSPGFLGFNTHALLNLEVRDSYFPFKKTSYIVICLHLCWYEIFAISSEFKSGNGDLSWRNIMSARG